MVLQQIIYGFNDIVSTGNTLISQLEGTGPIQKRALEARGPDADLVFAAFRELSRVSQATLNILIGKANILSSVPVVGEPVATALRGFEGTIDVCADLSCGIPQQMANWKLHCSPLLLLSSTCYRFTGTTWPMTLTASATPFSWLSRATNHSTSKACLKSSAAKAGSF